MGFSVRMLLLLNCIGSVWLCVYTDASLFRTKLVSHLLHAFCSKIGHAALLCVHQSLFRHTSGQGAVSRIAQKKRRI